jgi:dTDP-glucose pyrophosphorylase
VIPLTEALFIGADATIKDAIAALDEGARGIALVIDERRRLLGVVTDHDIRKALLHGADLGDSVSPFVTRSPVVAAAGDPREAIFELIRRTGRSPIPLLDAGGSVVGLESLTSAMQPDALADHVAVVMTGGRGTRMHPLTLDLPKPMLPVRGKPVLHLILENLKAYGIRRVYLAVHFRREIIEEYFADGRDRGMSISYLREEWPLGTAGALALLPERPSRPFVVMNGDLLTRVNFAGLMEHHRMVAERLTVCVRRHEIQVPYGVVELEGARVTRIQEKPVHSCLVSAGIYVLEPEVLDLLPRGVPCDMPDLVQATVERWGSVGAFPIHEYWLDVGQPADLVRAFHDYDPDA